MTDVSLRVVEEMARAIFDRGPSLVTEIYSAPGKGLQRFSNSDDLCSHASSLCKVKGGTIFIGVQYPEMKGDVSIREFELARGPDRGKHRFELSGWGMIIVRLPMLPSGSNLPSVYVISERAALAREQTGVCLPPVDGWNWRSVESHSRRLKRVLKSAVARAEGNL